MCGPEKKSTYRLRRNASTFSWVYWKFKKNPSDRENSSYGCRKFRPFFHYGTYSRERETHTPPKVNTSEPLNSNRRAFAEKGNHCPISQHGTVVSCTSQQQAQKTTVPYREVAISFLLCLAHEEREGESPYKR
jgi:hypothetical protein